MKTLLKTTLLIAALLFGIHLNAQQISLGVKTGVQRVNINAPDFIEDLEEIPNFKSLTTVNVGVVSEIAFHKNFALQPELNYLTKGTKVNENFGLELFDVPLPVGVTAVSKFHYLEMPLLAKAKFGNEHANFYVVAGPTFGYTLNGKLETRAKLLVEFDLFDTPIDLDAVNYERWEVGGMAGAGFSVNTGNGSQIFLDARYSHGFTQPYDIPLVHEKVQHKNFGVNIGFLVLSLLYFVATLVGFAPTGAGREPRR